MRPTLPLHPTRAPSGYREIQHSNPATGASGLSQEEEMDHSVGTENDPSLLTPGKQGVFPKVAAYLLLASLSTGQVIPPALSFHCMLLIPRSKQRSGEGEGVNPTCSDHNCKRTTISVEPAGDISVAGFSQVHRGSHHTAGL